MKQVDLATVLGVSRTAIVGYEQNTNKPLFENLVKIAEFLNVSYDYLIGNSESKANKHHIESELYVMLDGSPITNAQLLDILYEINEADRVVLLKLVELLKSKQNIEISEIVQMMSKLKR